MEDNPSVGSRQAKVLSAERSGSEGGKLAAEEISIVGHQSESAVLRTAQPATLRLEKVARQIRDDSAEDDDSHGPPE